MSADSHDLANLYFYRSVTVSVKYLTTATTIIAQKHCAIKTGTLIRIIDSMVWKTM